MNEADACPDREDWQSVLEGAAPAERRENYVRHLETCETCQAVLDRTESDEEMKRLARTLGDPTQRPQEPALLRVMDRVVGAKHAAAPPPVEPEDLHFLQPDPRPDVLGKLGDYEVREIIGQGGMGFVLKAFDPTLHRLVAIKMIAPVIAGALNARQRFTREAQAAAAVNHEHVVAVHGVSDVGGLPYLVMQYVPGESLQGRLDRTGPLGLIEAVRIGQQTAAGLAAAHAQGLIHRDIKPANLLLEHGLPRVKITDFGLARMVDDIGLTLHGTVNGTPEYMSPEQANGARVDHRSDLFSLGAVLYAMCVGCSPFRGPSALATLRMVEEQPAAPIRSLNADVPVWMESLIGRLLEKDPEKRFQSAAEVARLLEGYLAHLERPEVVAAPELTAHGAAATRDRPAMPQRTSWLYGLSVLLIAAAVGLGMATSFAGCGAAPEEPAPRELPPVLSLDFRGLTELPDKLKPFKVLRKDMLQLQPEGLGIRIPKAIHINHSSAVGVTTAFGLTGDFEITGTFEMVKIEEPSSNYGVGVGIYLQTPDRNPHVNLARVVRGADTQGILFNSWNVDVFDGFVPCADKVLRLRYRRTGDKCYYLWAPGAQGENFHLAHRSDFGVSDISLIRIGAFTAASNCDVSVRLLDLQIRGEATTQPVVRVPEPPAERPYQGRPVFAWLIGLLVALVLGLGVWLLIRLRKRPKTTPKSAKPNPAARSDERKKAKCQDTP
jgi:hypothetical protein